MPELSLVWNAEPRARDALQLLLNVIDALTLEPEFEEFFARAAHAVRELVDADGAALILLNAEQECEYQFFEGAHLERLNAFTLHRFPATAGVTGMALRENRALFVSDYAADENAMPAFVEAGLQASLILPLQGTKGAIGALAMSWFKPGAQAPDAQRLALAERIANQIAVACERRQLELRLAQIASRDALTGVANRARILEALKERLSAAPESAQPFAVALVDLDGFKAINDECGHSFGDRVLKDMGGRIRDISRRDDEVGRIGGDEFVIISAFRDRDADITPLLQRVNSALNLKLPVGRRDHGLSASIGVACYPQDGTDAETLLRRADLAMYRAKREGGDRYHFFDRCMEEDIRARQKLLDEIQPALTRGDFQLHYQPIVSVDENRTVAAEALLRWNHPTEGLRSAGEFIFLVERYGRSLVRQLGCWVLQQATAQLDEWQGRGSDIAVHVNVSACYFLDRSFIRDLDRVLRQHPQLRPEGLVLELTETALVEDLDQAAQVMEACRRLGVRLALDDFGTGYASLTYLKRLPVDMVKIDHSFVRDLCDRPSDRGIVRGILAMANALNLSVVAEGVETEDHVAELLLLGCGHMQGYRLAAPLPREQFEPWLTLPQSIPA